MPPIERLTCSPEPRVPMTVNDTTTAAFIVSLAEAGQNCRSALGWVRDWSARMQETAK